MPTYQYQAYEKSGKTVRGTVLADSEEKAQVQLKQKGFFISQIKETQGKNKKSRRSLILVYKQLAILLQGGKPLDQALDLIWKTQTNLKPVLSQIKERVHKGESLSQAMSAFPHLFSSFAVAMIHTGEEAGDLSSTMKVLAEQLETEHAFFVQTRNALAYPLFVILFSVAVVLALFTFVIPTLETLYDDLGGTLPLLTQSVLKFSHILKAYGFWIGLMGLGLVFLARRQEFKQGMAKQWLKIPFVKKWVCLQETSRFCLAMSTLLGGGMQVVPALKVVEPICKNEHFRLMVREVRERVVQGESLGSGLKRSSLFTPLASTLILAGEENGDLKTQLAYAGQILKEEFNAFLKLAITFLEPAMILFVGIVIAIVVLSVILPIVQLNQMFV